MRESLPFKGVNAVMLCMKTQYLPTESWSWLTNKLIVLSLYSLSIFLRGNELDITMGSVRVVLLLHKKNRDAFLWPVVHQQPKNANVQGILGKRLHKTKRY